MSEDLLVAKGNARLRRRGRVHHRTKTCRLAQGSNFRRESFVSIKKERKRSLLEKRDLNPIKGGRVSASKTTKKGKAYLCGERRRIGKNASKGAEKRNQEMFVRVGG